ncbi:MAG TPA: hypothetical protein VNO21_15045 [Polyangiaceae bacterium]|nr:hypothetical protein [Polyangiaceae bacterium]
MRKRITLSGSLSAALLLASASAWGDAVLTSPAPRRPTCDSATCQMDPCASTTPGAPKFKVEADADLQVSWTETVDRQGCFVFETATNGEDKNFHVLQTLPDDQNSVPLNRTTTIALDGGLACEHCVLRVRQIASGSAADCTATTDAGTYFSCADIIVGTDAAAPPPDDAGTTTDNDAGPLGGSTIDAGGSNDATNGAGPYEVDPITPAASKGCAAAPSDLPFGGLFGIAMTAAIFAMGTRRRRR